MPKLIVYFHGVGEDLTQVEGEMKLLSKTLRANVLVLEYPGYGLNWCQGICSEQRLIDDAVSVLTFVLQNTKLRMADIIIYGRSMGTAIAVALAKEFKN